MKRIVLAAATLVAATAATSAPGAGGLWPHVYSTAIRGARPAVLNGTWRLSIGRTTFSVSKGSALAADGTLRIAGNRITFHDVAGPLACHGAQAVGTYAWSLHGATLTLTRVHDTCPGRSVILAHPFARAA